MANPYPFTANQPVTAAELNAAILAAANGTLSGVTTHGIGTSTPYAPLGIRATNVGGYAEGINLDINDATTGSAIGIDWNLSTADLGAAQSARIQAIRMGAGAIADVTVSTRSNAGTLNEVWRATNTGLITYGGTTASFPAVKRSSTELRHRLADDTAYGPVAASVLAQAAGENGNRAELKSLTELTTIAAAATTDTTIQIPAGALVYAVSVRVTTVIPTATTFDYGIAGATTRYGTGVSTAANTTSAGTIDAVRYYAAATAIRITPNLTPGANTGRVRVNIHYIIVTPPTS